MQRSVYNVMPCCDRRCDISQNLKLHSVERFEKIFVGCIGLWKLLLLAVSYFLPKVQVCDSLPLIVANILYLAQRFVEFRLLLDTNGIVLSSLWRFCDTFSDDIVRLLGLGCQWTSWHCASDIIPWPNTLFWKSIRVIF